MNFESIIRMTQKELKSALVEELKEIGYNPAVKKGFLYAQGDVPVMLVAHLDTVHKQSVRHILYSPDRSLIMSPEGIGGDDRAGVYAILEIIKETRCHVLFCEDEEIGGHGARDFANSKLRPDINYIVELDRRGSNDAVFYGCDNPEFTDFVCGFGFTRERGSFSDISVIAPRLDIAAVNISAGYYNEHTRHEVINLEHLQNNIERVSQMANTETEIFEYIERQPVSFSGFEQLALVDDETETLSFFGYEPPRGQKKKLMPLPQSAHIKINGHLMSNCESYLIDESGKVYDYLYDLEVAVRAENTSAYSESGLPLRFDSKNAKSVKVISFESAMEQLGKAQ